MFKLFQSVKLIHTEDFKIVVLLVNGVSKSLFTTVEAGGVLRAFMTLKDEGVSGIEIEEVSKETLEETFNQRHNIGGHKNES